MQLDVRIPCVVLCMIEYELKVLRDVPTLTLVHNWVLGRF